MSLTVELHEGIGNQLFTLAGAETIAQQLQRRVVLTQTSTPSTNHSSKNYFDSIFQHWQQYQGSLREPIVDVHESSYEFRDWTMCVPDSETIRVHGFFQNYKYIPDSFRERLTLPDTEELPGAFLHIRGGDFLDWHAPFMHVNLKEYYERAVQMFPENTHFYVFTNDIEYAKTIPVLQSIPHTIVDEPNEIRTLALMSRCKVGGICANSTFSWWGAYLNSNRILTVPSKWFNYGDTYIDGFFFPGAHVVPV